MVAVGFIYIFWNQYVSAWSKAWELATSSISLLLILSLLNWGIEVYRWHLALKTKGLPQPFSRSSFQVLYAIPFALILGKIAGSTVGRLTHFRYANMKAAVKAQILCSTLQSLGLMFYFFISWTALLPRNGLSLAFAFLVITVMACIAAGWKVTQIGVLSLLRTGLIFLSYSVLLSSSNLIELVVTLSKTFAVLTFVPFAPVANLGPKEWLMHYFHDGISLQNYLHAGMVVFIFNNLFPAIVGLILMISKRWK